LVAALLILPPATALASEDGSSGIVASVQRAWVTSNGDVSGEPALWTIELNGSIDPDVPGRSLMAGHQIRVIFPPEFDLGDIAPTHPVADVPTPFPPIPPLPPQPCVPNNLQCTTGILLQGWPEHPLFPPVLYHSVSVDVADNAFVYTAVQDILPNPPANPGIKELFLLLNGVRNPEPGEYPVRVEAQTGPGGSWETGTGLLKVLPGPRPSINATAVFVKALSGLLDGGPACGPGTLPPNPDDPVFQRTTVNAPAPFVWSFLVWGKNEEPLDDLDLNWVNDNHAQLVRGQRVVGHVFIDAPHGAEGYGIDANPLGCPTYMPAAPVIGATPGVGPQPVGRLDLQFWAGDKPGAYTTTLTINNGNTEQMVVIAE
jgi:hypothetical protein